MLFEGAPPVEKPVPVQEVAFEDHVSFEDCPTVIEDGVAVRVAVGAVTQESDVESYTSGAEQVLQAVGLLAPFEQEAAVVVNGTSAPYAVPALFVA